MTIETELSALLGPIVDGRCYPDVTPDSPQFPLLVYQVVGGEAYDYLERRLPDCEHYRIQVLCWVRSRIDASALAGKVRQQIVEYGRNFRSAHTLGQRIALYESDLKLYGSRQDFGIWIQER